MDLDLTSTGLDVPEALRSLHLIFKDKPEYVKMAAGGSTLQQQWRDLGGKLLYQENCNRYGFNARSNSGTEWSRIAVWFNQESGSVE